MNLFPVVYALIRRNLQSSGLRYKKAEKYFQLWGGGRQNYGLFPQVGTFYISYAPLTEQRDKSSTDLAYQASGFYTNYVQLQD